MEGNIQAHATSDNSERFSVIPINIFKNKHLSIISVGYRSLGESACNQRDKPEFENTYFK